MNGEARLLRWRGGQMAIVIITISRVESRVLSVLSDYEKE